MWNMYIMEYRSVMQCNEILVYAIIWTDLENIRLREINQAQEDMIALMWASYLGYPT